MTSSDFQTRFRTRAFAAGVAIQEPNLVERLEAYYRLLLHWNQKINLTAIDLQELPPAAIDRLFIEPVAAAHYASPGCWSIDIGSGGGSPAIPFALAAHVSNLVMVESRARKSVFLREAARVVALPHASVVTARFEDLLHSEHQRAYDVLTVRALRVDSLEAKQLQAFLKPSGALFLFRTAPVGEVTAQTDALPRRVRLTDASDLEIIPGKN